MTVHDLGRSAAHTSPLLYGIISLARSLSLISNPYQSPRQPCQLITAPGRMTWDADKPERQEVGPPKARPQGRSHRRPGAAKPPSGRGIRPWRSSGVYVG